MFDEMDTMADPGTERGAHAGGDSLVALSGAGARAHGHWLVRGVDLTVRRGELVTLIGPNGSGKTTTAKMVIGLIVPAEGEISRARALKVGYVPQALSADRTMPMSVARLMTLSRRHGRAEVMEALGRVGIAHLADMQVEDLSGGEFRRALLARALIARPELLVLDEPVQGVDFTGELALYDLIQEVREQTGCGILLISHDLHVVMARTDTVVCLNGHVCCTGTPETVASSPEYARLFGRRAIETVAVYRHRHDHVHLADGTIRVSDGPRRPHDGEAGAGGEGGHR